MSDMSRTIHLNLPANFSFRQTVYSHGWSELAPFSLDAKRWTLSLVLTDGNVSTAASLRESAQRLRITVDDEAFPRTSAINVVRHILRLDDDIEGFYELARKHGTFEWVEARRAGRLLRSATVYEDLVKTMCTTNCSWSLTKIMVSKLVEALGHPGANGERAFPTAEQMAGKGEEFYRSEIRSGYRSPYFAELADNVASGRLDPESWLRSELPAPELKKEIKAVKGIGDYAAENLLKLLGRYDGLALDSWLRAEYYRKHNRSKPCADKKIHRHYAKFGDWRGLAIWCDMTEHWLDAELETNSSAAS